MDLEPTRTVEDEVRHHVAAALESVSWPISDPVEVYRGWVGGKRFVTPSLTVTTSDFERIKTVPEAVDETITDHDGDGTDEVVVTWRQASVEGSVSIDCYTETKTQRADLGPELREVFVPPPADKQSKPREGLGLTLDEHLDAFARVRLQDFTPVDDEGANRGYYRLQISLAAEAEQLRRYVYEQAQYDTSQTTRR